MVHTDLWYGRWKCPEDSFKLFPAWILLHRSHERGTWILHLICFDICVLANTSEEHNIASIHMHDLQFDWITTFMLQLILLTVSKGCALARLTVGTNLPLSVGIFKCLLTFSCFWWLLISPLCLGVVEYLSSGGVDCTHKDFKELRYSDCLTKFNCNGKNSSSNGMITHGFKLKSAYENGLMPYTNYTFDFKVIVLTFVFVLVNDVACV